jgi:CheY-like chemotaxis protein
MTPQQKEITACIIDDDSIFTYGFNKLIQRNGLFGRILQFTNGLQAIDFLSSRENISQLPDVIFVDINMPVMNGWEFLQHFEEIKSQISKNITLYMMSSSVDSKDINRAKSNPILADYLVKPINDARLTVVYNALNGNLN